VVVVHAKLTPKYIHIDIKKILDRTRYSLAATRRKTTYRSMWIAHPAAAPDSLVHASSPCARQRAYQHLIVYLSL